MHSPYGPEPTEVTIREDTPRTVNHKNRLLQVREILNFWRLDDEWWRKPVSRMYYLIEFTNGSRLTIFHDLITGKWFKQNWV